MNDVLGLGWSWPLGIPCVSERSQVEARVSRILLSLRAQSDFWSTTVMLPSTELLVILGMQPLRFAM